MNRGTILVSQQIKDDEAALAADPIIIGMAHEAAANGITVDAMNDMMYISAAMEAYAQRGGTYNYGHMGAPLYAVISVMESLQA